MTLQMTCVSFFLIFFLIWDFEIFWFSRIWVRNPGIKIFRVWDFFRGMGYPSNMSWIYPSSRIQKKNFRLRNFENAKKDPLLYRFLSKSSFLGRIPEHWEWCRSTHRRGTASWFQRRGGWRDWGCAATWSSRRNGRPTRWASNPMSMYDSLPWILSLALQPSFPIGRFVAG